MFLFGTALKNPPANAGDARDVGSVSRSGRSPAAGNVNQFQYSCLKNGQRSLAGYSPWGCKESDVTEQLSTHTHTHMHTYTHIIKVCQTLRWPCVLYIIFDWYGALHYLTFEY